MDNSINNHKITSKNTQTLCLWCKKENDRYPKSICSKCEAYRKENQNVIKLSRKQDKLCTDCGSPAVVNSIRCAACIKKQRIARVKHQKKKAAKRSMPTEKDTL